MVCGVSDFSMSKIAVFHRKAMSSVILFLALACEERIKQTHI
jgi:hypothetical protein